jgi:hypothetical protein
VTRHIYLSFLSTRASLNVNFKPTCRNTLTVVRHLASAYGLRHQFGCSGCLLLCSLHSEFLCVLIWACLKAFTVSSLSCWPLCPTPCFLSSFYFGACRPFRLASRFSRAVAISTADSRESSDTFPLDVVPFRCWRRTP